MSGRKPSETSELQIACSLTASKGAARIARWRALAADQCQGLRREGDRLVVRFRRRPGVREELDALAAAERECCSFAEWEVTQDADHVVLTVRSEPDGLATVAALFRVA